MQQSVHGPHVPFVAHIARAERQVLGTPRSSVANDEVTT